MKYVIILIIFLLINDSQSDNRNNVLITLKNNIFISKKVIHLYDIADTDNIKLENIDIAEFRLKQNFMILNKKHIHIRLMLYNDHYNYIINGPEYIRINFIDSKYTKTIAPGKKINLIYLNKGLEIKTSAELAEIGRIGDIVKLRIVDSSKLIHARLVDDNNAIYEQ